MYYLLKRIIFIIPTWFIISMIVFGLSHCASGDIVIDRLTNNDQTTSNTYIPDQIYAEKAHALQLDKPTFYVSILPKAFPDTLHKIIRRSERRNVEHLIWQYGNWTAIAQYYNAIKAFSRKINLNLSNLPSNTPSNTPVSDSLYLALQRNIDQLLIQSDSNVIQVYLKNLNPQGDTTTPFQKEINDIQQKFDYLQKHKQIETLYIPSLHIYGVDNQYHTWISRFIRGDFGFAKNDQPILEKLSTPLSISVILGMSSLVLMYIIGIPLGIFTALNRHRRRGRIVIKLLFAAYSIPTFWIATLAAMFLTTQFYGLKIFPSVGMAEMPIHTSLWQSLWASKTHFILPILCMCIHPTAVIARHMQGSMQEVLKKEYILTAKSKGLSIRQVIWRHALRNALTPLITLLAQVIPSILTGTFAVEMVFNLKGIGRTMIEAIYIDDWTVVYAVIMLISFVVLCSNLLTDMLYKYLNPRVL